MTLVGTFAKSTTRQATLVACLLASTGWAQDAGNGLTFSVSQNLSYSDNLDFNAAENSGFRSVTGLSLAYNSQTRVQGLQFSASTNAEFGSDNDAENAFTDPLFNLSYRRDSKNAGITAGLNFRRAEISSILGTQDLIDAGFITIDNGFQTDVGYNFGFDFGRTDPLSGSLTVGGSNRSFTETSDPTLLDSERRSVAAQVNLRFNPAITGRLRASFSSFEEDGGVTREQTSVGIGASFAASQTLSFDASINLDETERTDTGVTTRTDGLGFAVSAAQVVKGGRLSAQVSSSENENGRRTSLNFGRNFELRNGTLDFSVGAVRRDNVDGFDPTYSISFAQALPRGAEVSLQASQAFETNGSGDEAINTSLAASYSAPLTPVSSLSATANFRNTNGLGGEIDDASRLDLGVSYRHELAQDWGLVGGFNRSFATEEGEPDRTSNSVFVGLRKSFVWRP